MKLGQVESSLLLQGVVTRVTSVIQISLSLIGVRVGFQLIKSHDINFVTMIHAMSTMFPVTMLSNMVFLGY